MHNTGHQVSQTAELCAVAPNVCESAVPNLHNVTVLSLRVLRRLLDFWKISSPLLDVEAAAAPKHHKYGISLKTGTFAITVVRISNRKWNSSLMFSWLHSLVLLMQRRLHICCWHSRSIDVPELTVPYSEECLFFWMGRLLLWST